MIASLFLFLNNSPPRHLLENLPSSSHRNASLKEETLSASQPHFTASLECFTWVPHSLTLQLYCLSASWAPDRRAREALEFFLPTFLQQLNVRKRGRNLKWRELLEQIFKLRIADFGILKSPIGGVELETLETSRKRTLTEASNILHSRDLKLEKLEKFEIYALHCNDSE